MAPTAWFLQILAASMVVAPGQAAPEKLSVRALFERTARGTVLVAVLRDGKVQANGTGFVIDAGRKWVVTNHHVLPDGVDFRVAFPKFKNGRIVSDRTAYDLTKGVAGKVI